METFVTAVVAFVLDLVSVFLRAWLVMIALGGAHHDIDARIPALGYWTTFALVFILSLALPYRTGGDS